MEIVDPAVDVRKADGHRGGFAAQLGDGDVVVLDQHFEIIAERGDLGIGPRNKTPVGAPCVVEDGDDDGEIAGEILLAEGPHFEFARGFRLIDHGLHGAGQGLQPAIVIGDHVFRLRVAQRFDMPAMPWPRMAHQHRRGRAETLDQEARLVVDREAERPLHGFHLTFAEPAFGAFGQCAEYFAIVGRLDETELACRVIVALKPETVDLGGDAPNGRFRSALR